MLPSPDSVNHAFRSISAKGSNLRRESDVWGFSLPAIAHLLHRLGQRRAARLSRQLPVRHPLARHVPAHAPEPLAVILFSFVEPEVFFVQAAEQLPRLDRNPRAPDAALDE